MKNLSLVLVLLAAIAMPATLAAQEDESPMTLRLSFFMCDVTQLEAAMEEVEAQDIPVWNELVAEGMVQSHGYFVHSWASEWNVGIYTVAESIDAVIKASDESGRRLQERYGEAPGVFGQACPHHRDGFYVLGPSTNAEGADDEGEGEGGS